jgi:hypothetical protein
MMNEKQARGLTHIGTKQGGTHFFRLFMPYAFQRIDHPTRRHVFMPLNRDYKPLGHERRVHVDYEALAATHAVAFQRDPASLTDVWTRVDGTTLWLYNDSIDSRRDYFERLARLMVHKLDLLGGLG